LILLDNGYHPDKVTAELQKVYPQIMTKIGFELAPKPTIAQKTAQGNLDLSLCRPHGGRERSNAWMERCKSLVKNFAPSLGQTTAKLNLCFLTANAQTAGK